LDKLGINLGFLASQVVNFTLLAVLLYVLLYKPVLRMLDARKERIQKAVADSERAERRAAEAEQEYERMIEEARKEGQKIIAQATETSQKVAADIKARAEAEAIEIKQHARAEADREREQLGAELRQEVGDLSIAIARQLIGATVNEAAQRELVAQFLKETEGLT
jgi:F-type H+-transporting ATPase subunit b